MTLQPPPQLSTTLKQRRIDRGLGLEECADLIGVTKRVLADAERGATPRPANALKIADFWGYRPSEVWPLEAA